jgi:monoamine oxidase
MVIPTPTALLGAAQQAARPVGRIVFANTDNDASSALENAIEHGLRAAETVHRLLRPHSTRPILRRRTLVAQPSSSP